LLVPNPLVVDASPVIVLAKTSFLDLLRVIGNSVLVPTAVVREIQQAGQNDPAVQALGQTSWIQVVDPGAAPGILQSFGLDPGEEAVLAWSLANPGAEALIGRIKGTQLFSGSFSRRHSESSPRAGSGENHESMEGKVESGGGATV